MKTLEKQYRATNNQIKNDMNKAIESTEGQKTDRGLIVYHDEQILVSGLKVWRSTQEYTISGLDIKSLPKEQDSLDTYDYLWGVFDKKTHFKDTDRKINIRWGSGWNSVIGSLPVKNILEEEIKIMNPKMYNDSDEENDDLQEGNWHQIVESHIGYFMEVVKDIMKRYADVLPLDETVAVAMLAICEFAKELSEGDEPLRSRFRTAAYSRVRTMYRDALEQKEAINMKAGRQKIEDQRTLNNFLTEFKNQFLSEPTIDEICNGLEWGHRRVDSTFKMFDFNVGKYRPMNDEEMLYTVMDEHLTDRQADIIEMSYGLGGSVKSNNQEIADDLNINEKTVRRDKREAFKIIEEHLGFKFSKK